MSMKQGLHQFGDDGRAAVKSEMTQLHECDVMRPMSSKQLTAVQRKEELAYLMFLEWKQGERSWVC